MPPVNPLLRRIGLAIRRRRELMDLSQEELGNLSNLHRTYVGGLERGERNPTILTLEKVTSGLQTTVIELLRKAEE